MAGPNDLHALRRRIGALMAAGPQRPNGIIALGDEAIDGSLPDNGLAAGAVHELLPESSNDFAATLGFGLGLLTRLMRVCKGPILWIAPTRESFRCGIAYPIGLAAFGFDPARLYYLTVEDAQDTLWAMEEALASGALAAVFGLLPARDKTYSFTESRRLSLRAAESGVTAFLLRQDDSADQPTAAVTRWSIATRQSTPVWRRRFSMPGLGPPRWQVNLVRCKRGRPRSWPVEWDHETFSFRLASPLADRTPAVAEPATVIQVPERRRMAS